MFLQIREIVLFRVHVNGEKAGKNNELRVTSERRRRSECILVHEEEDKLDATDVYLISRTRLPGGSWSRLREP